MNPFSPSPYPNPFGFNTPSANEQALGRLPWQYNETQWETTTKDRYRTPIRPPFHVELEVDDALQFEYVVYLGYVYELISYSPLQLIIHKPINFDDDPILRFPVADGSLYVKVLLKPNGSIETEGVEIVQLDEEPLEEDGVLHYKLASTGAEVDGRPPLELFLSGSNICYARNAFTEKHPFKVTPTTAEPVEGSSEYEVYFGNAGGIAIGLTNLMVEDTHYIFIVFSRDPSSRLITSAILDSGAAIPDSDYNTQYVKIAQVNAGDVVQHRFEDIRVSEFLIAEAGELKLISVFDTTNSYDPPP